MNFDYESPSEATDLSLDTSELFPEPAVVSGVIERFRWPTSLSGSDVFGRIRVNVKRRYAGLVIHP